MGLETAAAFDDHDVVDMDRSMLLAEKASLFPDDDNDWGIHGTSAPVKIEGWNPSMARAMFADMFDVLRGKLEGTFHTLPPSKVVANVGPTMPSPYAQPKKAKRGRK